MKQSKNYENYRFIIQKRTRATTVTDWSSGCPWHFINFIQEGSCVIKSESMTLEMHKGDLYYIPMGLSYKSYWKGPCQARTMGFRIFPDSEEAGFILQKLPKEFVGAHRSIALQGHPDVENLGKFYTLLSQLVPIMQRESSNDRHTLVNRARKEFCGYYMRASIGKIALVCGVSESTLYHAFQKVEGTTPNTVRHEIVVQEAIRLLTDTNTPIQRISNHLGFSSDTYFRKVIKDHTGLSPRQIRKNGGLVLLPEQSGAL